MDNLESFLWIDSHDRDTVMDYIISTKSDLYFLDGIGNAFSKAGGVYFSKKNNSHINYYLDKISLNMKNKFDSQDARRRAMLDILEEMYSTFRKDL